MCEQAIGNSDVKSVLTKDEVLTILMLNFTMLAEKGDHTVWIL